MDERCDEGSNGAAVCAITLPTRRQSFHNYCNNRFARTFSRNNLNGGPRVTALRARERLNLHRRLKITMIRRRSEQRALLNAMYIPFAIGGRGRMINNAGPIRYTPWYKRNTCANREAEDRDVGHDRGWREERRERRRETAMEEARCE